jgi:hypothetical protein
MHGRAEFLEILALRGKPGEQEAALPVCIVPFPGHNLYGHDWMPDERICAAGYPFLSTRLHGDKVRFALFSYMPIDRKLISGYHNAANLCRTIRTPQNAEVRQE